VAGRFGWTGGNKSPLSLRIIYRLTVRITRIQVVYQKNMRHIFWRPCRLRVYKIMRQSLSTHGDAGRGVTDGLTRKRFSNIWPASCVRFADHFSAICYRNSLLYCLISVAVYNETLRLDPIYLFIYLFIYVVAVYLRTVFVIRFVASDISGAFAKLRRATSFVISVCLSARNNSAPTGRIFIKYLYFSKICWENEILIKSLAIITGTVREDVCTFVMISRTGLPRMKQVADTSWGNQNTRVACVVD